MYTQVKTGDEALKKIVSGVQKVAKPVIDSLGPNGANTIIQRGEFEPLITNDGVTIARSIRLRDPEERQAADAVIQAALRTNFEAGDGTSTTIALTSAFIENLSGEADKYAWVRKLSKLSSDFKDYIDSVKVSTNTQQLKDIAFVSCQSEIISDLIVKAFSELGDGAVVNMEESLSDTKIEVRTGLGIDSGYANALFCNDIPNRRGRYPEGALVATYKGEVTDVDKVIPLLETAVEQKSAIIIAAYAFSPAVLGILHQNSQKGFLKVMPIILEGTKKEQDEVIDDIELFLSSELFSGSNFTGNFRIGAAASFECSISSSTFGVHELTEQQITDIGLLKDQIENEIKTNEKSELYKSRLQKRKARLDNGFAILSVGGETKAEVQELKLRAEDAIMACRSALEMGHVEGGGKVMKDFAMNLKDELLKKSILSVVEAIEKNVPSESTVVPIDPAKVLISAMKNSTSIAKTLLTANSIITKEETNE